MVRFLFNFFLFLFCFGFFLNAECFAEGCIEGNNITTKEQRQVPSFNKIDINGVFDVAIQYQKKNSITVTADKNLLPHIVTRVTSGKLYVFSNRSICTKSTLHIDIKSDDIEKIQSAGANDLPSDQPALLHQHSKHVSDSVLLVYRCRCSHNLESCSLGLDNSYHKAPHSMAAASSPHESRRYPPRGRTYLFQHYPPTTGKHASLCGPQTSPIHSEIATTLPVAWHTASRSGGYSRLEQETRSYPG